MTAPEQMLKPCPFCKRGDGSLDLSLSLCGHYFVDCGCNAQGPWERTKAEAIAAWNTRPAPVELVEALAEDVGERIASEFRGFWAPEDLVAEIPAMIREAAALRNAGAAS